MKKIFLLIALIVISLSLNSQFANTQTISSPTTLFKSKGGLSADSAILFLNSYPDTATANFSVASKYNSIIRVGTKYYYRTLTPDKWNEFTTAASSFFLPISDTTSMLSGYKTYYPRTAISAGTGILYNNTTGVITNSAPDQTVALTAGSGVSITGTYPNFTIANTSPSSGGTVTAVATNAGSGITGGTIFGSGTIAADTLNLSTRLWRQKGIDSINGLLPKYIPYYSANKSPNLGAYGLYSDFIQFKNPSTTTDTIGRLRWNTTDKTMNIGLTNDVVLQTGQEVVILVRNQTGVLIPNGTIVRQSGVVGASGKLKVEPFLANGTHNSNQVVGVTTENIPHGSDGFITTFGKVNGINTSAYPDSTILYASTKLAGKFTDTIPEAPNNIVKVGTVINSGSSNGIVFVRIIPGSNIHQDEGVQLINPVNKSLLVYDSVSTLWKNGTLSTVGGLSINDTATMLSPYARDYNVVHISGSETITGNKTFNNVLTLGENAVGDSSIYIGQMMAGSDRLKIFGTGAVADKGEMVFQVGDNGIPYYLGGQRFRFSYDTISGSGLEKDVFIIDYDSLYTPNSFVADKIIKIGGTSSQYLKADGSTTTLGTITSGAYTPTLAEVTNSGSLTLLLSNYTRIDSVINVSVYLQSIPAAIGYVELTFTLPFSTTTGGAGVVSIAQNGSITAGIATIGSGDTALVKYYSNTAGASQSVQINFQYKL